MTKNNNENGKVNKGVGAGAVIGVGAALAAGYYFYMSKDAKKHRKLVADWANDLKDDVSAKMAELGENLNQENIMKVIDQVAEVYYTTRSVAKEDVGRVVGELKENWAKLVEEMKAKGQHPSRTKRFAKSK